MVRVAVVDRDLCKPSKCNLECIRFCPLNRRKKIAIELHETGKYVVIHEETCIGCGICIKKCPYNAITIINLPDELEKKTVHRYGKNAFKLYGLPIPVRGKVLGIIGKNGSGKTTTLRILAGELKPNLGNYEKEPSWDEVIRFFRGTELQNYFKQLAEGKLKVAHKIQYVELVPRYIKGTVGELLQRADDRGIAKEIAEEMGLAKIWDRKINVISGGELQKLLIAATLSKEADVYLFDEPSSYLDVRERIRAAKLIRNYLKNNKYVIVVEHDLAVLDYLSDLVSVVYGEPGAYGIVSKPYSTRNGINYFLEGFLPAENMRIRSEAIKFHAYSIETSIKTETKERILAWSKLVKELGEFKLMVEPGEAYKGEVVGLLGPNGIGKTTFVRILAGEIKTDEGSISTSIVNKKPKISYKPQYVSPKMFDGTVRKVLMNTNSNALNPTSWLYSEVIRKLRLNKLLDQKASDLSGGELQKLAIASCIIRDADIYLLDEPSAYLDVEERLTVAKVLKRIVEEKRVLAFVVEHDVSIQDFISDRIMVFRGEPGIKGIASPPLQLRNAMNMFLKDLGITFRRDPQTGRPRVNKEGSYLDRYQKTIGEYYYIPVGKEEEKRRADSINLFYNRVL